METHDPDIERQLKVAAVLIGYPLDALLFVLGGFATSEIWTRTHISAEALCWLLHDHALKLFGADAKEQLARWSITKTEDFGELVYGMAEHGLLSIAEDDSKADFENLFDFKDNFVSPKFQTANSLKNWSIASMFVVTTVAAIAISGFSRSGLDGAFQALFWSWFIFIGMSCIYIGIFKRSSDWLLLVSFGIISLAAGLFAFLTFSY